MFTWSMNVAAKLLCVCYITSCALLGVKLRRQCNPMADFTGQTGWCVCGGGGEGYASLDQSPSDHGSSQRDQCDGEEAAIRSLGSQVAEVRRAAGLTHLV